MISLYYSSYAIERDNKTSKLAVAQRAQTLYIQQAGINSSFCIFAPRRMSCAHPVDGWLQPCDVPALLLAPPFFTFVLCVLPILWSSHCVGPLSHISQSSQYLASPLSGAPAPLSAPSSLSCWSAGARCRTDWVPTSARGGGVRERLRKRGQQQQNLEADSGSEASPAERSGCDIAMKRQWLTDRLWAKNCYSHIRSTCAHCRCRQTSKLAIFYIF